MLVITSGIGIFLKYSVGTLVDIAKEKYSRLYSSHLNCNKIKTRFQAIKNTVFCQRLEILQGT